MEKLKNKVDDKIQKRVQEHYDYVQNLGYDVIYCAAQGSMNYNLFIKDSDYVSDVDTKCFVVPTLSDLIKGAKMVSTKYDFKGEQIDVKDIRIMMEMWRKQNPSYIEILFSDYYIVNPKYKSFVDKILNIKDDISHMNEPQFIRSLCGMAKEKDIALKKPYPSTISKIEKYGYDPKQFSSIIRLANLADNFFNHNMDFKESIFYKNDSREREYLIEVKKGKYSLEFSEDMSKKYVEDIIYMKNKVINSQGKDNFNDKTYKCLKEIIYSLVKSSIEMNILEKLSKEV